jgi:hypothetical protein
MDEAKYFTDLQTGRDEEMLTKALQSLNEGRNEECFPLVSFGWKDADLEPAGCTGITRIVTVNDYGVTVEVGGHKTFVPSTPSGSDHDYEQEIIFDIGWPGEWTGDDWTIVFSKKEITVEYILNDDTTPDYYATAKAIIVKAREELKPYWDDMTQASNDFDKLKG